MRLANTGAISALEARLYNDSEPIRASAYPYWLNPFRWYGVVETKNFYAGMLIDSSIPDVDPDGRMRIRYKAEETPASLAAKQSYLGRVYLDWAKYPVTETEPVEPPEPGYIVRFRDLRFDYPDQARRGILSAGVRLDRNLKVVSESFGSRSRRVATPPD